LERKKQQKNKIQFAKSRFFNDGIDSNDIVYSYGLDFIICIIRGDFGTVSWYPSEITKFVLKKEVICEI
jgi:hypothetical protein